MYNPSSRINFEKSNISPSQKDKSRFNHTTNRSSISSTGIILLENENISRQEFYIFYNGDIFNFFLL